MPDFADLFTEGASGGGARYWKAGDFTGAAAILVEVRDFKKDQPRKKKNDKDRDTEDIAFCDITVFDEPSDVKSGNGVEYLNVKLNQSILAADLQDYVGKVLVKTLTCPPGKSYLVWRQVEPDVVQKVGEYYNARNAQRKAAEEALTAAGDDVPDWAK